MKIMKKISLFFLTFFFCVVSFSQQILSFSTQERISVKGEAEKSLQSPTTVFLVDGDCAIVTHHYYNAVIRDISQNKEKYSTIRIKGYGFEPEVGKPQLPGYSDFIPLRSNNATLQVSHSGYIEFKGIRIMPTQMGALDGKDDDEFAIDHSVYNKNKFFPESLAKIQDIQDYRGQKYAFVRVNPIQYNPVTGVVRCYQNIEYRINNIDTSSVTKNARNGYESLNVSIKQEKYIIVTSNEYLQSIEDFVKWKESLGYHISVLSKSQWTDDNEVKDSIRAEFYRDTTFYDPRYLLIVGGVSKVPAKKILSNNLFVEPHYLTDHYFACMGDDSDCLEDIARGRILLYTPDSVRNFFRFLIRQEKTPSYYGRGVHSAYFNSLNDTTEHLNCVCFSEETRKFMVKHNFQVDRIYKKPSNTIPLLYSTTYASGDSVPEELRVENFAWDGNADSIKAALRTGCDYIMYKGHGTSEGFYNIGFNSPSLIGFNDNICSPLFFCFACQCGQYGSIDYYGDVIPNSCFAGTLMLKKMSCGVIASSGNCNAPYLEPFGEAFFSSMYLDSLLSPQLGLPPNMYSRLYEFNYKRQTEIGEMMRYGHTKMLQSFGFSEDVIKETTHMHVFGDPSYHFPTCPPRDLDSIDIYRENDSICINLNGIFPCTIIFIKEDVNGTILAYKRMEDLEENCHFMDSTNYNRIIIKKNNSAPIVLNHIKNIYLQNINIYANKELNGGDIWAGKNVTDNIPIGEVVVKNGGSLKLKHSKKVFLEKGFKVELGGKLSVNKQ